MLLDLLPLLEEEQTEAARGPRVPFTIERVFRDRGHAAFTITASGRAIEVVTSGRTEIAVGATSQAQVSARAEIPYEWVKARYLEWLERDFEEILLLLLD